MDPIQDYRTRQPRRLEIPISIKGVPHVVIARENNDGEAICYVYCLSKKQNDDVNDGGRWDYPTIRLSMGETENIFGMVDIEDVKLRVHVLDIAWHAAQRDARAQAAFLQKTGEG
jgi:hypothetical protein